MLMPKQPKNLSFDRLNNAYTLSFYDGILS